MMKFFSWFKRRRKVNEMQRAGTRAGAITHIHVTNPWHAVGISTGVLVLPGIGVVAADALSVASGADVAARGLHASQVLQVQIPAFQRPAQRSPASHGK